MRIFNSLTRSTEVIEVPTEVKLYVCGVTPYDTTHLGHARTYLVFDVLVRHLMHLGHQVRYVQNITDVDDSIIQRARELDVAYDDLGDRFTAIYLEDMASLGMIPAQFYPRATAAIPEIQSAVRKLLGLGNAYRMDGSVYFRISTARNYGRLSALDRDRMLEIERDQDGSTVNDPGKEDPLDFVLWRGSDPGDPGWDSPWGRGRPGWHIECSVMAMEHLGPRIDIHGGGDDLVFPHHEAEIAQSEALSGEPPFARYWVHVGMARMNGRKMSKSEGNMLFVRDLLGRYAPDALRLYLLATHYRGPLDHDEGALQRASELAASLAAAASLPVERRDGALEADAERAFGERLDDDLDTPGAIRCLAELAESLGANGRVSYRDRQTLRELCSRLGLQLDLSHDRR